MARSVLRVCVAREFTKLADRTSPVVGWLRALAAASAYGECGGPGVGVDEPGHPTRVALDRVLTFLAERLHR